MILLAELLFNFLAEYKSSLALLFSDTPCRVVSDAHLATEAHLDELHVSGVVGHERQSTHHIGNGNRVY